jgi:hypothetical protein
MKCFKGLLAFGMMVAMVCSCSNKKEAQVNENGLPVFEFTEQDSVAIRELANDYMTRFQSQDYESAAQLLYTVHNDSIFPLTDEQRQGYLNAMAALPITGSALKELNLYSDRDNQIRIALLIGEGGDLEAEKGTINFFLNPVEVDGKWYRTLMSEYAEGVGLYH